MRHSVSNTDSRDMLAGYAQTSLAPVRYWKFHCFMHIKYIYMFVNFKFPRTSIYSSAGKTMYHKPSCPIFNSASTVTLKYRPHCSINLYQYVSFYKFMVQLLQIWRKFDKYVKLALCRKGHIFVPSSKNMWPL